jgi:hypothetical protein
LCIEEEEEKMHYEEVAEGRIFLVPLSRAGRREFRNRFRDKLISNPTPEHVLGFDPEKLGGHEDGLVQS